MLIVDFFMEAVLLEPYLFICFQTIVVLLDLRKTPSLFPLLFRCNHLNRADLNWLEFMRLVILLTRAVLQLKVLTIPTLRLGFKTCYLFFLITIYGRFKEMMAF